MTVIYDRVALIGLGLIAGSMAHAMRAGGLAGEIVGYARSAETRAVARDLFCDRVCDTAAEAVQMGLANKAVPDAELDAEVERWCAEILEKSPTALELAKRSFNADTAHIAGISSLGLKAVSLFYGTEESQEGVRAFQEKRKPNFRG